MEPSVRLRLPLLAANGKRQHRHRVADALLRVSALNREPKIAIEEGLALTLNTVFVQRITLGFLAHFNSNQPYSKLALARRSSFDC